MGAEPTTGRMDDLGELLHELEQTRTARDRLRLEVADLKHSLDNIVEGLCKHFEYSALCPAETMEEHSPGFMQEIPMMGKVRPFEYEAKGTIPVHLDITREWMYRVESFVHHKLDTEKSPGTLHRAIHLRFTSKSKRGPHLSYGITEEAAMRVNRLPFVKDEVVRALTDAMEKEW